MNYLNILDKWKKRGIFFKCSIIVFILFLCLLGYLQINALRVRADADYMMHNIQVITGSRGFGVSSLLPMTTWQWNYVEINHDLFYRYIYFDFIDNKGQSKNMWIRTDVLWINEDYSPKSPSGKVYSAADSFLFFTFNNGISNKIIIETLDENEEVFVRNIRKYLNSNNGFTGKISELMNFEWQRLSVKSEHGFVYFLFDNGKKEMAFHRTFISVNLNQIDKIFTPSDICTVSKNDTGSLLLIDL